MSAKERRNLLVEQISREGALTESEVLDALSIDEGDLEDVLPTTKTETEAEEEEEA